MKVQEIFESEQREGPSDQYIINVLETYGYNVNNPQADILNYLAVWWDECKLLLNCVGFVHFDESDNIIISELGNDEKSLSQAKLMHFLDITNHDCTLEEALEHFNNEVQQATDKHGLEQFVNYVKKISNTKFYYYHNSTGCFVYCIKLPKGK